MITGLQRTGTTKLQRLLSFHDDARPLQSWEALYPAPVKKADERGKRIRKTRMNERAVKWISPNFYNIHPIDHQLPEEDVLLLDIHFMSTTSEAILHVPSYAEWLEKSDHSAAYEYEVKLLKLLQWQNGQKSAKYWVLKSPHHLEHLDVLDKTFPSLNLIWMHRNPAECIPSFLSMIYHSRTMFSNDVSFDDIKNHWFRKIQRMLDKGMANRVLYEGRLLDIGFADLIANENDVLNRIGNQFSIEIKESTSSSKKAYKSKHKYDLSDWGWGKEGEEIKAQLKTYYQLMEAQGIKAIGGSGSNEYKKNL